MGRFLNKGNKKFAELAASKYFHLCGLINSQFLPKV